MITDHSLAVALVDKIETLGARFSFFVDHHGDASFAWLCQGIENFSRCPDILALAYVETEFGEVFWDELVDRYLSGRLRIDERRSA